MGAFCLDHQIIDFNFKAVLSSTYKEVPFVFIYKTHFGRILAKSIHQGGCCICFWNETSRKIENTKYLFYFKAMEMQRGHKFVPGKMFLGIKSDFSRVLLVSRG